MHTRMTDILIKTGRYSLRIAVVASYAEWRSRLSPVLCTLQPRAQGRRACPDPAVLPDAGRRGLPLQSAPEPRADPAGRGAGGARGAGAGHRSAGGGAEVQSSLQSGFLFQNLHLFVLLLSVFLYISHGNIWCVTQYDIHPFWWTYFASHAPRWQRESLPGCRFQPSEESRSLPFVYSPQMSLR